MGRAAETAVGYSLCLLSARAVLLVDRRELQAGGGFPSSLAMLNHHARENSSAHVKPGSEAEEARCEQGDQVVADTVCDGFVESPFVAKGPDIELQALQFHAFSVRDIVEEQRREVRLPGPRAQADELRDRP